MAQQKMMKGEVMRNAMRLVKTRGEGALQYAKSKAERMQDVGEEEDQIYWDRISRQIELLLYEDG
ncbi:MAG: hypothetical protein IH994_00905 [Proteobacteria bacterium]|nr:hypothetical protein [Pseudomonadota bacterium]